MRERILDVAASKIEIYGLKKFTIDEIAIELKISKKTIYKYFRSKDEIVKEFFNEVIRTCKENTVEAINYKGEFSNKLHKIVCSNNEYKIPINIINEAKLYYPEQWEEIQKLKNFKLDIVEKLIKDAIKEGKIKEDIDYRILSKLIEKISDMFFDYDFLVNNNLTIDDIIDGIIKITLKGILK